MAMRTPNGHPADDELLLAADAKDGAAERSPVDRHLDDCAACRARLDVLQAALRDAAEQYQRLTIDDIASTSTATSASAQAAHAAQRARLAAALSAIPAPRASWWQPFSLAALPPWAVVAAAAAVIVIALILPSATWLSRRTAAAVADDRPSLAGELPAAGLTPGATASMSVRDLCAGRIPSRVVSSEVRDSVLRAYGMKHVPADAYELDALITPELGGTTDASNLWPQRYASMVWHARVKDVLEERLAADVCAGRLDLVTAQRDLATDWVAAYRRYFKSDVPLQAHLEQRSNLDEPELIIAPPRNRWNDHGLGMRTLLIIALPLNR